MIRKNKTEKKTDSQMIDIHAHILPGIDDGAASMDDAMILLRELAEGGVTEVFATPHYVEETIYTSPKSENLKLIKKIEDRLKDEGLKVKIHLGNEIYITRNILKLVRDGKISRLGGEVEGDEPGYLLVELPMSGEYPGYVDIFLELLRAGYKVILAHPERYAAFQKNFSLVMELHEMGVLFQCNLGSFVGQYGKKALKLAQKMAREKMIFALGSDIHHPRGGDFVPIAIKHLRKFYNEEELEEILIKNVKCVII